MIAQHTIVRDATPEDAISLEQVFRESWRHAYRGIIPHCELEAIIARHDRGFWRRIAKGAAGPLVLEVAGVVAGYASFGPSRARGGGYEGEIFELYLTPTHQGLGFGERLFESARHRLDEMRARGLIVWALSENESACAFYERRGGRPVARGETNLGGKRLEKIAFGWPG